MQVPMDCSLPGNLLPSNFGNWPDMFSTQVQQTGVKYETPDTPPHTPPRDLNIIPPGPISMATTSVPMAPTTISMPTKPLSGVSTTTSGSNTIKLVIPAQGTNGAVNVTHVIGGAGFKGQTPGGVSQVLNAKVKIQPKPATTVTSSASSTATSRPANSLRK